MVRTYTFSLESVTEKFMSVVSFELCEEQFVFVHARLKSLSQTLDTAVNVLYDAGMNTMNVRKIAVSDVDGTIVKGSLVLGHAVSLHREGVLNLGDLPDAWMANQKDEKIIPLLAEAYRNAIKGKTVDEIGANKYVNSLVENDENFYSVLSRLKTMQSEGARVVLISGSPSFLVESFGNHFGFDSVGSNYTVDNKGKFTGLCVGMFSGDAKREYLSQLGMDKYAEVFAFGDTQSDQPLFESASYSVLVEPNNETMNALGHTVNEILHI